MKRKTILFLATAIALFVGWLLTRQVYAAGTTLVVNGSGDLNDFNPGDGVCDTLPGLSGDQCGLRAAIEELNALGPDTTPHRIEFNISGTGPFTITPGSPLPAITVPVVIAGASQPDATCPTSNTPANLQIVLDGSDAGAGASGLVLDAGSDGSTIRGLVIANFTLSGIRIYSDSNQVSCTHVGIGADGVSGMYNYSGVTVYGRDNSIGGQSSPAQRNVISGNGNGIHLAPGSENNIVVNNFVGTTADGTGDVGNFDAGIHVSGNSNVIGEAALAARNVISGNVYGIHIFGGEDNTILGNYVGVARDGVTPLPNSYGILVQELAVANVIGGTADGEANRIAFNLAEGVTLSDYSLGVFPIENEIRGNAIYANGSLGIDLGNDGVDTNDPGDSDGGENERQNYPVLVTSPGSPVVDVTLDSEPNTVYQIDTYLNDSCDPSGFGEGQEYFQTFPQQTDSQGQLQFQFSLGGVTGRYFTATATDPDGNTSEFSNCALLEDAPTATPTATNTPTPTNTPTATSTPTLTSTPTATGTATSGPSPTPTNTASPTFTPTATSSPTVGPTPTATRTPTATSSPTAGPSPTPTTVPEVTPTETPLPPQDDAFYLYLPLIIK